MQSLCGKKTVKKMIKKVVHLTKNIKKEQSINSPGTQPNYKDFITLTT
jgi:hypothetical protein